MLLSILVTAVVVAGLTMRPSGGEHGTRGPIAAVPTLASRSERALAVLRHWDHRRAAAWAHDHRRALAGLYVSGSAAGQRDVAMLTAYDERGLRVRSMRRQVLAVHVRRSRPRLLSIVVTDRLVDATVSGSGRRRALPDSRPATRRIELRRAGRRWRVSEVYAR
jgi:hypothetical protein